MVPSLTGAITIGMVEVAAAAARALPDEYSPGIRRFFVDGCAP
jgi:hypothetical protein